MNLARTIKPFLYISMSILIAQCSGSSGDESPQGGLVGKIDPGRCVHSPYEGSTPQTSGKSFSLNKSGYFEKTIITDKLDSLLSSSSLEIANYILRQGVQLYKVDEQSNSECQYFRFLDDPTDEAQKNWDDNSSPSNNGTLLGLFTTYYVPRGEKDFFLREPTIMVRQDTQKWTLLHEFSHFLFADARVRAPMYDHQTLREQLDKAGSKMNDNIDAFDQDQSRPNARKLISSIKKFFELSYELDQRGPLEEFSIESMLVDRLKRGDLNLVNNRLDVSNAIGYMTSNKNLVVGRYERVSDFLRTYNKAYFQNNWPALSTKASDLENQVNGVLSFIDRKMFESKQLRNQDFQPSALTLSVNAFSEPIPESEHHHFDMKDIELQEELYSRF